MSLDRNQAATANAPQYVPPAMRKPTLDGSTSSSSALLNSPLTRLELFSTRLSMPFVTSFSGAVSGIASGVVTCPLDVIKTKLQAQGGFQSIRHEREGIQSTAYRGLVGTARSIWREEGIRGMYRGLFPMMLGYFPTWAVYFTVYDGAKGFWYQKLGPGTSESRIRKSVAHLLTSVTAGGCSTIITNPIWVIKTRLMSQVNPSTQRDGRPPWHYKSTWDAARKMYLNEGILSFYSGLTPALLGLTHVAVQFPLYEYLKFKFTGLEMGEEAREEQSRWLGMCVATVLSKFCASAATYPHEVLRTRLQTQQRSIVSSPLHHHHHHHHHHPLQNLFSSAAGSDGTHKSASTAPPASSSPPSSSSSSISNGTPPRYRGIMQTVQTILREEGWRAFYVGMGTNMIRAVPAATTTILTYEYMVGRIKLLQSEGQRKLMG